MNKFIKRLTILGSLFLLSGCAVKEENVTETPLYTVNKVEEITKNLTGGKVAELSFEQIVFEDSAYDVISERMEEARNSFFEMYGDGFRDYVSMGEESDYREGYFPYTCTNKVKNVYANKEYVSIVMDYEWFVGGAHTYDLITYNYSVQDGTAVSIEEVSGLKPDDIKENIFEGLDKMGFELDSFSAEILNTYDINEMSFYVDSAGIYAVFPTGEIGSNADGCMVVPVKRF